MIVDDLWTAKGPAPADLKVLERLAQCRLVFEAFESPDEEEAIVIARALATLDDMEECLCEEGRGAPLIARGWQTLDRLEARLAALRATRPSRPGGHDVALAALGPRCPRVVDPPRGTKSHTLSIEGSPSPHIPGDSNLLNTSIETLRSVARRVAEDPSPGVCVPPAGTVLAVLPRIAELVSRLLCAKVTGSASRIVVRALSVFTPLLELCHRSPERGAKAPNEPQLTVKDEARIDLLHQERAARAQQRSAGSARVRPDRPPETRLAQSEAEVWNDMLDLISEALEIFIRFRNAVGVNRCLELLDLLSEALGVDQPEAA